MEMEHSNVNFLLCPEALHLKPMLDAAAQYIRFQDPDTAPGRTLAEWYRHDRKADD